MDDIQAMMDDATAALNEWEAAQDAPQVTKLVALVNKAVGVVELIVTSPEEATFALATLHHFAPSSPVVRNLIAVPFEHVGEVGGVVMVQFVDGEITNGDDEVLVMRLELPY